MYVFLSYFVLIFFATRKNNKHTHKNDTLHTTHWTTQYACEKAGEKQMWKQHKRGKATLISVHDHRVHVFNSTATIWWTIFDQPDRRHDHSFFLCISEQNKKKLTKILIIGNEMYDCCRFKEIVIIYFWLLIFFGIKKKALERVEKE